MRDIRIDKLTLRNFKGMASFVLDLAGRNAVVYGDNATGKTTLADAWYWMTGGKDSDLRADFNIKTLDGDGNAIHHLEHEVEGALTVSGAARVLKRMYKEKWTRQRGAAAKENTGHHTKFHLGAVLADKAEFERQVATDMADIDTVRMLSDPYHFAERVHWQDRRALLLEVCGDVTMEDIVASRDSLVGLVAMLGDLKPDQHRKMVTASRATINKELEHYIPNHIDEAQRALQITVQLTGTAEQLEARRDRVQEAADEAASDLLRLEEGGEVAAQELLLAQKRTALVSCAEKVRQEGVWAVKNETDEVARLGTLVAAQERQVPEHERCIAHHRGLKEKWEAKLPGLAAQRERQDGEQMTVCIEDVCAACGQDLPAEEVKAAHDAALGNFNEKKAEALAGLDAHTAEVSEWLAAARTSLAAEEEAHRATLEQLASDESALAEATKALEQVTSVSAEDPEYAKLFKEFRGIEDGIARLKISMTPNIESAQERKDDTDAAVRELAMALTQHAAHTQSERRIDELKGQERELAREFEDLGRQLFVLDEYTRARMDLLTGRINDLFQVVSFVLFEVQVNGGLKEVCDVSVDGVPYADLNTGARVKAGLDVIRTLQRHHGLMLPVWVDHSESVTRLPQMDCQLIQLAVSKDDAELRVVLGDGPAAA